MCAEKGLESQIKFEASLSRIMFYSMNAFSVDIHRIGLQLRTLMYIGQLYTTPQRPPAPLPTIAIILTTYDSPWREI